MSNSEEKVESTNLDKMREARELSTVAFMEFITIYRNSPNHIFCFFEGEDAKYYSPKIESVVGRDTNFIKCNNKHQTLKIWERLTNDSCYSHVTKLFFVDKDMDEFPENKDDNLYITPCYSIENLYVNKETFERIMHTEFSLNTFDQDFKKCTDLFSTLLNEFNEHITEFNACLLLRKRKSPANSDAIFSNFKVNQAFSVDLDKISKTPKYKKQISKIKTALDADEREFESAIQGLTDMGDFSLVFRGKNNLDFMVLLLILLKNANNTGGFFEKKIQSVTLNLTKNRLSELSQYAVFPQCLKDFLEKHKVAS